MLKPQDIVVLLKVYSLQKDEWTYSTLASSVGMSASEVHTALKRCSTSRLYDAENRQVFKHALLEFVIHGLKYVYPGQPGPISRGLPTAHSAEPLKSLLVVDPSDAYVWPDPTGEVRGQAIEPLYRSVPMAAKNDQELYVLLSLIDAIRVGRVREQRLAQQELERRVAAR